MKAATRPGTVVYDVHDPGRHGIVHKLHVKDGKLVASVKWIGTDRRSEVPGGDLRRVTAETPRKPDRENPGRVALPQSHTRPRGDHF